MLLSRGNAALFILAGLIIGAGPVFGQAVRKLVVPGSDSTLTEKQLTLPRDTVVHGLGKLAAVQDTTKPLHDTSAVKRDTIFSGNDTLAIIRDTLRIGADTIVVRDSLLNAADSLAFDSLAPKPDTLAVARDTLDIITSEAGFNTLPGFRVQLLSTQNLLEAITTKAKADSLLKDYNVYIVYDSPYYKVRVGDFHARYQANNAVNFIADHGFPDAWPVPDNVYRRPPKRANN